MVSTWGLLLVNRHPAWYALGFVASLLITIYTIVKHNFPYHRWITSASANVPTYVIRAPGEEVVTFLDGLQPFEVLAAAMLRKFENVFEERIPMAVRRFAESGIRILVLRPARVAGGAFLGCAASNPIFWLAVIVAAGVSASLYIANHLPQVLTVAVAAVILTMSVGFAIAFGCWTIYGTSVALSLLIRFCLGVLSLRFGPEMFL